MSLWNTITEKVKGIFNKMIGKETIQEVLHIAPAISGEMFNAISLWTKMYEGKAPWLKGATEQDKSIVKSLGLPQLIASEKARTALLEFESEITTPIKDVKPATPNYMDPSNVGTDGKPQPQIATHVVTEDVPKGPTERAEFLNKEYVKLKDALRVQIEYGIAKGGLVIKPYPVKHENPVVAPQTDMLTGKITQTEDTEEYTIEFDYVQANDFYPLAFDASGKIIEAAFVERKVDKDTIYSRLEYHKLENNSVTVINKAFKTKSTIGRTEIDYLGDEISLTDVPEWSMLSPETKIANVNRLLFAYFKMPEANTIDTHSPLGVSGFDKVKGLIAEADKQYSRLLWEFEGGELAIDIDRDALKWLEDPNQNEGHSIVPKLQERLYRKVDLGDEKTYEVFSPALRDQSLINGLNCILMRIEDGAGISRGTLSDATNEAKTATELRMLRIRSYETNAHIQKAIEHALEDTIYIMNIYCDLYEITPDGEYEVSYEWDDSIINDTDTELTKRMILIQNGIASKLETRMWYFGETERQAREALMRVQEESLESVQQNIEEMQLMGGPKESLKENSPEDDEEGTDNPFKKQNKDSNTVSAKKQLKSGDNQYS